MSVTWILDENGILTIEGTENADRIAIQELAYDPVTQSTTVRGSDQGITSGFRLFQNSLSGVKKIVVNGYGGDDSLLMLLKNISSDLYGGNGDDILQGSPKIDIIQGGNGNDTIQTSGNFSQYDLLDGGEGIDTFNNKVDANSRLTHNGIDLQNSIEVISLNRCAINGNDSDNIFNFSATTLDNVGGTHAWYQRSGGGNDLVFTSPYLVNIYHYQNNPKSLFWYDGDGHGNEGTQDRINIVFTAEQLSHLTLTQLSQLTAYVVNPGIYQRSQTFSFTSNEAGIAFRASSFEQASILLKSESELIDITDSLLNTQKVTIGSNKPEKLVARSNYRELILGLDDDDVLVSGKQNDILSGGLGKDIFRFKRGFGQDTITDFKLDGDDKIDLKTFRLSGISDLTIARGDNIVITSSAFGNNQITLQGFSISGDDLLKTNRTLLASDFLF